MLRALHLFDPHLRLAHRDLSRVMWQLIDIKEGALHLLGGIALQHMDRHATALGIYYWRAALFELIPNCHHGVCLISGTCGGCWESELANRSLELLARDAVRQDAQLRELANFSHLVIGVWCLIPLSWNQSTVHRSADRLVVHFGNGR